jgi:hypothetical protein
MSEENTTAVVDLVRHQKTACHFPAHGRRKGLPGNFEQVLCPGEQLLFGQATVAICNRFY